MIEDSNGKARPRRSSAATRALVIAAARGLFAERGYGGTTTREIAQRAGTSEMVLFRIFKTKAQLFEAAVFEPFDRFLQSFLEEYGLSDQPLATPEAASRRFVEGLYRIMSENRELILLLIATGMYEEKVTRGLKGMRSLNDYFDIAEAAVRSHTGDDEADLALGVRLSFGLVAAAVLFGDWLLPGGQARPTRARLIDQLSHFISSGVPSLAPPVRRNGGALRRRGAPSALQRAAAPAGRDRAFDDSADPV